MPQRWPHPQTPPPQTGTFNTDFCYDFENLTRNPGTVEELHARWKEMLPQPFEGAKLLVQKGLSNNFQVHRRIISQLCSIIFFFNYFVLGVACAYNVKQYAQWLQVN